MNWNPYKRIAELEAMHTKNIAVLNTLADKLNDLSVKHNALGKWMVTLEDRLHETNQRLNPYAAAPVRSEGKLVSAKVADAAEQKRIKQREYQRAYYAKQRVKAKQNEYQRAYRARKKAAAQAVGGTA